MKKMLLAAALLITGTFAPQTEMFGHSVQNSQTSLAGGPDTWVMEGWIFIAYGGGILDNLIESIEVKDQITGKLVAASYCGSERCAVDLNPLRIGLYVVTVETTFGSFKVPVYKR